MNDALGVRKTDCFNDGYHDGEHGLDGEAVRDVLVLDRFSFLSVPAGEAERVIDALDGRDLRGQALSLQRVG